MEINNNPCKDSRVTLSRSTIVRPENHSAVPSHFTLETLGPSSTVISFKENLRKFEEKILKKYEEKVKESIPSHTLKYGFRNTIINLPVEREKRHFPWLDNKRSPPDYHLKPQGRRYIPHGYGDDFQFVPHPPFQEPEYTDIGPDWKSRLRYVPSPHNPDCGTEIWPDDWKSLRTYPWMNRRTDNEWTLHPYSNGKSKRCQFDGVHKATSLSANEVTHSMLFGKGKLVVDRRNGIPLAAPGDKSYQAVEYSYNFYKDGSALPVVNFGGSGRRKPDTFVPLQELPPIRRESYHQCDKVHQIQQEISEVRELERWKPATPLQPTGHTHPLPIAKNDTQIQMSVQEPIRHGQ